MTSIGDKAINIEQVGETSHGEAIYAYQLIGPTGLQLRALNYGGIITHLLLPDRDGVLRDITLGYPHLDHYLAGHPWMGAIAGRVAGRITGGSFTLEGKEYQLELNHPPNHLHGGTDALDKRVWHGTVEETPVGEPQLVLTHTSPHGQSGYPGTVNLITRYRLSMDNELIVEFEAESDQPTPLALTQHLYFNLNGEDQSNVLDHWLQLESDETVLTDEHLTLTGQIASVKGKANDFREPKQLGDVISSLWLEHGDMYLNPPVKAQYPQEQLRRIASLYAPSTGIEMEVKTTARCVQLYTGSGLSEDRSKSGKPYGRFAGICLECQGYPDGVNSPEIEDITLYPGQTFFQQTSYRFLHRAPHRSHITQ